MPASDESNGEQNATRNNAGDPMETTVDVRVADESEWTIDPNVFGKFTEMNAREGYPGILSEHLANGSFEEWYTWPKRSPKGNPTWWRRSEVLYRDTDPNPGVAYPWEPVSEARSRITFENPIGGSPVLIEDRQSLWGTRSDTHGREAGQRREDVLEREYREPEPRYQRITVWEGRAGIEQRLALPDERTLAYDLSISLRGRGLDGECVVTVSDIRGETVASETMEFEEEWGRRERRLDFDRESATRYEESPFGEFILSIEVVGRGHLDLDWAHLRAGDAVEGRFNPTTIDHIREYGIPCIRWPGGNFVSQYHWRDGIGPVATRPVRSELHWGGLEPNYLGVNEFLEFCDIADVEPYLNVGFSREIRPEEAGAMVEYVNGHPENTELGALRAEHGHEEPWNVETWQVGNEVWGEFQIGHTDATDYAERYLEYHAAMTQVDPDITVMAVGLDPGDEPRSGNEWNEAVFEGAGNVTAGLDIHRYVHGEVGDRILDPVSFNQELVLYPTQFEAQLGRARRAAEAAGVGELQVTVGEWNMGAGGLDEGPRARYGTMAHAVFCAGMYNTFLREGDVVRFAHQRDNAFKHRPYPTDLRPMYTANNAVMRQYTAVLVGDREWHYLPTTIEGATGRIGRHGESIEPMDDVPYVDAAAARTADSAALHVFVANRDLTDAHQTTVGLPTEEGTPVSATVLHADDPLDPTTEWDGETSYTTEERSLRVEDGVVALELAPAAFARLDVTNWNGVS